VDQEKMEERAWGGGDLALKIPAYTQPWAPGSSLPLGPDVCSLASNLVPCAAVRASSMVDGGTRRSTAELASAGGGAT
jgi:hypothetical protein